MNKIIKKIFLALVLIFAIKPLMKAQNWCTPNSVWHFNYYSQWNGPGYVKLSYAGTVIVNSQACQQIDYHVEYYHQTSIGSSNGYTMAANGLPYYTYENNNIVYLYNQVTNHFDTLYNYFAFPGDSWYLPARYGVQMTPTCPRVKVNVIAVGLSPIGPINLKWLKVSLQTASGQITDTIYQRLGLLNNYFYNFDWCSKNLDYTDGGALRCFSDSQISTYSRTNRACDFIISSVGIKENKGNPDLKIYPNPANNLLSIEGLSSTELTIFNSLGVLVHQSNFENSGRIDLDVSALPKGIYYLETRTNQSSYYTKFVKE